MTASYYAFGVLVLGVLTAIYLALSEDFE